MTDIFSTISREKYLKNTVKLNKMSTIQLNGFTWTVSPTDAIGATVLRGQNWEPHLMIFLTRFLKNGDNCIDVGACFGWHTLQMARIVGNSGHVYAFEPQQGNLKLLNTNIENNGLKNITVINKALGHKKMKSCICSAYKENEENWGDGFVSPDMEKSDINKQEYIGRIGLAEPLKLNKETIQCETMNEQNLKSPIKFIKIDVQGFEKMVLEGGVKIIDRDRPVMVIEVENPCLVQFDYSSKELFETIRGMNYYIYLLDYEYPCDHVCVPTEYVEQFETIFEGSIHPHYENNSLTNNVVLRVNRKVVVM